MNIFPPDPASDDALARFLASRRGELAETERDALHAHLAAHPETAREAESLDRFLEAWGPARVEPSSAFRASLGAHVQDLFQELRPAPVRRSLRDVLRDVFRALVPAADLGVPGLSPRTLMVARLLALYLGVVTALSGYALWVHHRDRGVPVVSAQPPGGPLPEKLAGRGAPGR